MKKIVIMYDFFSEHGGVERIMLFQAKALKEAGYKVVFAFAYVDESIKKERLSEFEVIEYSPLSFKNETAQISLSILRNGKMDLFKDADLIICHSFPASYFALRIKKKFKVPYILHLHHPPQFLYNADKDWASNSFKRQFSFAIGKILRFPLRKFDKYCVKNANGYFIECETVQKIIKKVYNLNGKIIYPTVNPVFRIQKKNRKILKKYKITKNYLLGSGRVIPQKRFDFLINAFAKLKKENFQIVLAGKYQEDIKRELENLAKKLGVAISILGPVEIKELIALYNFASATVLTCPKEWFGLVPVESIACGCPVIAWGDEFGPEETIIDGKNGFLAKAYNTDDMAEKIQKVLDKKWNRKKISKTALKFSENKIKKKLIKEVTNYL